MKRLLFLLLYSLLYSASDTQTIDPASEWRVNISIWDLGDQIHYDFYRDFIDGDTTKQMTNQDNQLSELGNNNCNKKYPYIQHSCNS